MMKLLKEVKEVELENAAVDLLSALISNVPFLKLNGHQQELPLLSGRADLVINVRTGERSYLLVCEVQKRGQPSAIRNAAAQVKLYCERLGPSAYGVVFAPFLSEASQAICREYGVGFADLEGNCRLVFDSVFIEKASGTKPAAERRELRSIFAPKSAQVIRVLLRNPSRRWKVTELAEAASVSVGHVSNVRSALIEREWAKADSEGLHITEPDALLDSWRGSYRRQAGARLTFYTTLHGAGLKSAIKQALSRPHPDTHIMLGSFSAAEWLAPYARIATEFFYTDELGLRALESALELSSAAKGENVVVTLLDDDGLFLDAVEPAPGITCTSPVQTYLDLCISGGRGREAAEHLRAETLQWR